ncbi:MAG: hypothetical protein ACOYNG_02755, partial [Terrimicrobiaceae bacterium]
MAETIPLHPIVRLSAWTMHRRKFSNGLWVLKTQSKHLNDPFGALDAKVRKELRKWLREFHDQTGLTTIFVTHDQDEAFELA